MFKQPIQRFFNALTFYTRLPAPQWVVHNSDNLNRASGYFPLMGIIVASLCYGIYLLCAGVLSHELSILISMACGLLITGAFHEDGFADLCDGFGGGFSQADILRIMKDSRLGTYGVSGLLFILLIKYQALVSLDPSHLWLGLVVAHSLSRAWAISLIMLLPYVQADETSKAKPIAKQWFAADMVLAWACALVPLYFVSAVAALLLLALGAAVLWVTRSWFKHRLQGYTGDALGASQQVHEIFIYLILIALNY